ncbi:hypothetical protein ACRTAH_002634 [Clostridium perfringens]
MMVDVLNNIIKYIMFLLSYSPVLCFSDDEKFGTNEFGIDNFFKRIRISLFSIYLGAYKFYFISFKKISKSKFKFKFNFIYKLNLNDYNEFTEEIKTRVGEKQEEYLNDNMNNYIELDKEFILHLFENENNRKNIAYGKINTYTTIVLAMIPIILVFFKPQMFINTNIIIKVLIVLLLYVLSNFTLLLLQVNKVRGYYRTRYCDFKKSILKKKEIIKSYYFDWQSLRYETENIVSFVRNIEVYIRGAIVISILISGLNFMMNICQSYKNVNLGNSIIELDVDKLKEKDSVAINTINKVNEKIPDKNIDKILILYNNKDLINNKDFKAIYDYFNIYIEKDNIILLNDIDEENNNIIKIIIIGR